MSESNSKLAYVALVGVTVICGLATKAVYSYYDRKRARELLKDATDHADEALAKVREKLQQLPEDAPEIVVKKLELQAELLEVQAALSKLSADSRGDVIRANELIESIEEIYRKLGS